MSNRAAEYRGLVDDVVDGWGLLEEDERAEIRDLIERVKHKPPANMPAEEAVES